MPKEKTNSNPISYLSKKLWKYSRGNRKNVVLFVIMFIIADLIVFLEPLAVGKLLDIIQQSGITTNNIRSLLLLVGSLLAINIGFWIFHGPARVIETKNAFLARAQYKKYLLDGVLAFPAKWHADHHSGATIDKVEKGTKALFDFGSETFSIIESIIRLVSSYFVLIYFNLSSAYIIAFIVIFTITLIVQFDKRLVRQYKIIYGAENKISAKVFDIISNITTVIILRVEKLVSGAIFKKIMSPFSIFTKNKKLNEVKWFLVSLCSSIMTVLVLGSYLYGNLQSGSVILIGTVYALYGYVGRISDLFYRFAYMYGDIVQQRSAVLNAEEITNEFQDAQEIAASTLATKWNELKITSLQFSYHEKAGEQKHLEDISVTIRRGQRIALIGESGSGKTTFLKIIRELYQPQSVKIFLDGKQLKNGFKAISSDIALIPQDPEIFATTIKENITIGVNHEPSYIKKYTDMACFTNVVERLPKKLDSLIFEKGVNLSGGEKQRLALSRGLMACADKEIILLDEPTSSVDTKNEMKIFQNIFQEFGDKTIVASVHRLHLLSLFDEIYFFKAGKIIANGTLSHLLETCSEFEQIWTRYLKLGKRAEQGETEK